MGCVWQDISCPIPIAYDENNEIHVIPDEMLPVKLPQNINLM